MIATLTGVITALVSGVLNGSFALPMKETVRWEWENIWLIWAFWALIIIPVILAIMTVPNILGIYRQTETTVLLRTLLLGAGWGFGAITFGLGVYMVGLSLGFSIIVGVTAVSGSLIPMIIRTPEDILKPGGLVILGGMLATAVGVAFCGRAGAIKDKLQRDGQSQSQQKHNFKLGLIVCLVSGLLNSMLNLSFVAGAPIAGIAKSALQGSSLINFRASNPIWVLTLFGAFITNLSYCSLLLIKKGSWKKYTDKQTRIYWFYAFVMGFLWTTGIFLYGAGASSLGKIGATVAWVIIMATSVLAGNFCGFLSGEWKGVEKKAMTPMLFGVVLLVGSIMLVSLGNYILGG